MANQLMEMIELARQAECRHDWAEALRLYGRIGRSARGREIALSGVARVKQYKSDFRGAEKAFRRLAAFRHGQSIRQVLSARSIKLACSEAKLKHDLEQVEYWIEQGIVAASSRSRYAGYRKVMELARGQGCFELDEKILRVLGKRYYGLNHVYAPAALRGPALGRQDWDKLEKSYRRNREVLVIDDFLSPKALGELRRAVLESSYWFDVKDGGYLGSYAEDGFVSGLHYQVADELRRRLANVIGDHPLSQMWAYKYDQRLSGIRLHSDPGVVNVNFWVTPDGANEDPESGGMIIYPKIPPQKMPHFDIYDAGKRETAFRKFLIRSGAPEIKVPYRENRVVIFNSQYFHMTDDLSFKAGYSNRRVNITLVYGNPPNDPHFWSKFQWARDKI